MTNPGSLLIPVRATVKGRVRWQVLDERGVPEVPRTPSGVPIGPVEGIEQDNLITDYGMDLITTGNRQFWKFTTLTTTPHGRSWLAVGTGSIAPAVTDTVLNNETERANTSGAFGEGGNSGALDVGTNEWVATSLCRRLTTVGADRNLTEFGFAPVSSGGSLSIRELLRDGVGTPITVSLLAGKTLRVEHTFTFRIPAPALGHATSINIEEYDATNTLVGTTPVNIIYGFTGDTASGVIPTAAVGSDLLSGSVLGLFDPGQNSYALRRITSATPVYDRSYASTGISGHVDPASNSGADYAAGSFAAYTPGSFTRTQRWTTPTGLGNAAWHGFIITKDNTSVSTTTGAFVVLFDGSSYTKVDTDTLRVGLVHTWARG